MRKKEKDNERVSQSESERDRERRRDRPRERERERSHERRNSMQNCCFPRAELLHSTSILLSPQCAVCSRQNMHVHAVRVYVNEDAAMCIAQGIYALL